MDTAAVRRYFGKLGLEPEIADIYLSLYSNGPQSISALSRSSQVERTRIYRLIDRLLSSNLVEVETHQRNATVKAAPISNLRILINQREQELKNLTDELELMEQVLTRNGLSNPALRVQMYRGQEGARQMLQNELTAKGEILGYGIRATELLLGKQYLREWQDQRHTSNTAERLLINHGVTLPSGSAKGVVYRAIGSDILAIANPAAIYDNVTTHYQQKDGEVFGIEVYNQELADMQRQLFERIWQQSAPAD